MAFSMDDWDLDKMPKPTDLTVDARAITSALLSLSAELHHANSLLERVAASHDVSKQINEKVAQAAGIGGGGMIVPGVMSNRGGHG